MILGLDIGGMSIKCGIVDKKGHILGKLSAKTPIGDWNEAVSVMAKLCRDTAALCQVDWSLVEGIGAGAPGVVNGDIVACAENVGWHNVPFVRDLSRATGKPVLVANDANCALLAERAWGAARGFDNVLMVTLGTGVGTAFIADGKLILGNGGASGEGGHMRIKQLGKRCNCGRYDCWEVYASATALQNLAVEAAVQYPTGKLAIAAAGRSLDGKLFFDTLNEGDAICDAVLNAFLVDVVDGLVNICNLLRPQRVVMGGGISQQTALIAPLTGMVNAQILGGALTPQVEVVPAVFFNDAGIIGGASLWMQHE